MASTETPGRGPTDGCAGTGASLLPESDRFTNRVFVALQECPPDPAQRGKFHGERRALSRDARDALRRASEQTAGHAIQVVANVLLAEPTLLLSNESGRAIEDALDLAVRIPIAVAQVQHFRDASTIEAPDPFRPHVENLLWMVNGEGPDAARVERRELEMARWFGSRHFVLGDWLLLRSREAGDPIGRSVGLAMMTLLSVATPRWPDLDAPFGPEPTPPDISPINTPDPEHSPVLTGGTGSRWAVAWAKGSTPTPSASSDDCECDCADDVTDGRDG